MADLSTAFLPTADDLATGFSRGRAAAEAAAVAAAEAEKKKVTLTPAEQAEVDARTQLALNPRGALGEIGTGLARGLMYELPKMVGSALQSTGKEGDFLHGVGSSIEKAVAPGDYNYALDPNNHGAVTNALAEGGSMLAPSLAPMAAMLIPGVGPVAAAGLGAVGFGASQFQETYEKAKKAGKTDEEAFTLGMKTGSIEGLGEGVGTLVGAKLITGAGKSLLKGMTAEAAAEAMKNPKLLLPLMRETAKTGVVEVGTEMGQASSQAAVEASAGLSTESPWDAATHAIGPTLGMMAFMGPLAAFGMHHRQQAQRATMEATDKVIADPNASLSTIATATGVQANMIGEMTGNKQAAQEWRLDQMHAAFTGQKTAEAQAKAEADAKVKAEADAVQAQKTAVVQSAHDDVIKTEASAAFADAKTTAAEANAQRAKGEKEIKPESLISFDQFVAAQAKTIPKEKGNKAEGDAYVEKMTKLFGSGTGVSQWIQATGGATNQDGLKAGYKAYLGDYIERNRRAPAAAATATTQAMGDGTTRTQGDIFGDLAQQDAAAATDASNMQAHADILAARRGALPVRDETSQTLLAQADADARAREITAETNAQFAATRTGPKGENVGASQALAAAAASPISNVQPAGGTATMLGLQRPESTIPTEQTAPTENLTKQHRTAIIKQHVPTLPQKWVNELTGLHEAQVPEALREIWHTAGGESGPKYNQKIAELYKALTGKEITQANPEAQTSDRPAFSLQPTDAQTVERQMDLETTAKHEAVQAQNEHDYAANIAVKSRMGDLFSGKPTPTTKASRARQAKTKFDGAVAALKRAFEGFDNEKQSQVPTQVVPGAKQEQKPDESTGDVASSTRSDEAKGNAKPVRNDEKAGQVDSEFRLTAQEAPATTLSPSERIDDFNRRNGVSIPTDVQGQITEIVAEREYEGRMAQFAENRDLKLAGQQKLDFTGAGEVKVGSVVELTPEALQDPRIAEVMRGSSRAVIVDIDTHGGRWGMREGAGRGEDAVKLLPGDIVGEESAKAAADKSAADKAAGEKSNRAKKKEEHLRQKAIIDEGLRQRAEKEAAEKEAADKAAAEKAAAEAAQSKQEKAKAAQKAKKEAAAEAAQSKQEKAKAAQKAKKDAEAKAKTAKQEKAKADKAQKTADEIAAVEAKAKAKAAENKAKTDNREGGNAEWQALGETETASQRAGDLKKGEWFPFEVFDYDRNEAHALGLNFDWVQSVLDAASSKASAAAKEALAWLKKYTGEGVVALAEERMEQIKRSLGLTEAMSKRVEAARKALYDQMRYDMAQQQAEEMGLKVNFEEGDIAALNKFFGEHPLSKKDAKKLATDYEAQINKLSDGLYARAPKPIPQANWAAVHAELSGATTVGEALKRVSESKYASSIEKVLARALRNIGGVADASFTMHNVYGGLGGTLGVFYPSRHAVEIFKNAGIPAVLHEAVHAATHNALDTSPQFRSDMSALLHRARMALAPETYEYNRTRGDRPAKKYSYEDMYGLESIHELVSEAFSNPKFQQLLAGIKSERNTKQASWLNNLWSEFKNLVRSALKLAPGMRTLLDDVIDLTLDSNQPLGSKSEQVSDPLYAGTISGTMSAVAGAVKGLYGQTIAAHPNLAASGLSGATRRTLLGLATANHIKEWVQKTPALASLHASVKGFFDTFDTKTNMIQTGRQESHAFLRTVETALAKLGKGRDAMSKRISELGNEMSRMNLDYTKTFAENQKLNKDLTAADVPVFQRLQDRWNTTPKEFQKMITDGIKLNRKYYVMNTAAVLYNLLGGHVNTNRLIEPIMKRIDLLNNPAPGMNNARPNDKLHLDDQSAHFYAELDKVFAEIRALPGNKMNKDVQDATAFMERHYRAAVKNPYLHLGRTGNFYVSFDADHIKASVVNAATGNTALGDLADKYKAVASGVTATNNHVYMRFESAQQMEMFKKEAMAAGFILPDAASNSGTTMKSGMLNDKGALTNISGVPAALRELVHGMDKVLQGMPTKIQDELRSGLTRMIIEALPESSPQKAQAQRKGGGVHGYEADFVHSFAKRSEGMTTAIANAYTMPHFDQALRDMKAHIEALQESNDTKSQEQSQELFMELAQRFSNSINPVDSPTIDTIKALGYNFYLALSPAFMLVNSLQPYHLSLPVIGGRHGFAATASKMFSSAGISMKLLHDTYVKGWKDGKFVGVVDAELLVQGLNVDHQELVTNLMRLGKLDFTQAHELGRMASGESHGPALAAKVASLGSHITEINNRLTTAFTAFDLEREKLVAGGMSAADATRQATEYAVRTVDATQFNYADHNTARFLGRHGVLGKVTPLVMSFQQYSFQSMELLARLTRDAFSSANPNISAEQKKEAQRALMGVSTMTMGIAGVLGLPFANLAAMLVDSIGGALSGDDDPWDVKTAFREYLASVFGKDIAEVISRGVPRAIGVDVSSRAGMQDILPGSRFLTDKREFADKVKDGALSAFGPAVNAGVDVGTAISHLSNGDVMGALTLGLPLALRNPAKAAKLMEDGFTTKTGNELPVPVNAWDTLNQALGFTPAKKAEQGEANYAFKTRDAQIVKRMGRLANDVYLAVEKGKDTDKEIEAYVDAATRNPQYAGNLGAAMGARAKARAVAELSGTGIATTPHKLPTLDRYAFANTGIK